MIAEANRYDDNGNMSTDEIWTFGEPPDLVEVPINHHPNQNEALPNGSVEEEHPDRVSVELRDLANHASESPITTEDFHPSQYVADFGHGAQTSTIRHGVNDGSIHELIEFFERLPVNSVEQEQYLEEFAPFALGLYKFSLQLKQQ